MRPQPFYLGILFAAAGLLLSLVFVRVSRGHSRHEAQLVGTDGETPQPSFGQIVMLTSWKDRALSACSQAGMVNNLNDGLAWGLLPLYFAAAGLGIQQVAILAVYPGVWSVAQVGTGALSDKIGRKGMIVAGMWLQAGGIRLVLLMRCFATWAGSMALLGLGTAWVPFLLGDSQPAGRAVGYRGDRRAYVCLGCGSAQQDVRDAAVETCRAHPCHFLGWCAGLRRRQEGVRLKSRATLFSTSRGSRRKRRSRRKHWARSIRFPAVSHHRSSRPPTVKCTRTLKSGVNSAVRGSSAQIVDPPSGRSKCLACAALAAHPRD
jgi:hypothetical protein